MARISLVALAGLALVALAGLALVAWLAAAHGGGGGEKHQYRIVLAGHDAIYSAGTDGSGLAKLSDIGDYSLPSLSPDTLSVVWLRRHGLDAGDVCTSNLDGTGVRSLADGQVAPAESFGPVWLADGSRIAFSTSGYLLYFVNIDGTGLRRAYDDAPYQPLTPGVLSPDGSRILDTRQVDAHFQVFVEELVTRHETELGNLAAPFYPLQAWSPDGNRVVFLDGDQTTLHVGDIGAGTFTTIELGTLADRNVLPAWSTDGSRIALAVEDPSEPGEVRPRSSILTVNADGTDLRKIVDAGLVPYLPGPPQAALRWSPDGRQIFYVGQSESCYPGGCTPGSLYVINSDGTGETRLADALFYAVLGFQGRP
jgi:dipeptidyl aminopeptidase/acylaminoacyl peptidase